MFKRILILILLVGSLHGAAWAQSDLQFSQYMFNYLYVNPAYAGYKEQVNATTFLRAQYLGVKGAPMTASFSIDAPLFSDNMGFGFQVNEDKIGIQNSLTGGIAYSYRIEVGDEGRFCLGFEAGMAQSSANTAGSNAAQSNDPVIMAGSYKTLDVTSKAGLFYYTSLFYLGASASNLYTKSISSNAAGIALAPLDRHYYLSGGVFIQVNDAIALKPSFLLKDPQHGITTADINAFVLLDNKLWLGASYRRGVISSTNILKGSASNSNAAVFLVEYYLNDRFRVGYAYDFPLGGGLTYVSGNHEISIGYYLPVSRQNFKNSMVTPRYF